MRPYLVLAVLVLAAPFAAGNQPPVAVANAPASVVLGEPVTFASASFDPDGTIVATTWEFTDGRERSGTSVTYVFHFPGVHTVGLRVTDDDGASASTTIQVLVHATLMHGRATALRVDGMALADTGEIVTSDHVDRTAAVGELRQGGFRAAALDARLFTVNERAVGRADLEYVYVPVPVGYILLTGVEAETIVGCAFPTHSNARFTQLRLNDAPIVPPGTVAPNTRVDVPGVGMLDLHVSEWVGDRLTTVAARLTLTDGRLVEVARAEAGVTHCPHT